MALESPLMKTPLPIYIRLVIVFGSTLVYAAILFPILYPLGGQATLVLSVIPMAIVGWFLGVRAALVFGIISLPLNLFLIRMVGDPNAGGIAPHLVGGLAFTPIGMIIGWIRELLNRVNRQAKELREERTILHYPSGRN